MDIESLRMFTVVAEHLSFISASQSLGVAQPTLSRKIRALEDELKVKLFHRGGRSLSLTPHGKKILKTSKNIILELNETLESLDGSVNKIQGSIKLGLLHPMARWLSQSFIADFINDYPNIQLELMTLTPKMLTEMADCDLMISPFLPEDQSLIAVKVYPFIMRCYASPAYIEKHGSPTSIQDLSFHNCIVNVNCPGKEKKWELQNSSGEITNIQVSGSVTTDSVDVAINLAEQGIGIALLPQSQVTHLMAMGKLINVFGDDIYKQLDMYIVYRSREHMTKRFRTFIDEYKSFVTTNEG
ncbi:LysR family transcriptional regulator [Photobacterium sp. SDRW27]|uniref:LysR family transcriptional regulator n=1 Tax=Photobacterium obscurum TaxID=2829490 RepID=UPI0022434FDC|nr:LysR family transcriptional regulator [Photobacterium obscurum]MCW8328376.1 LysR family transcriptional regulator [Photobacterium obscurum]